MAFKLKDGSGVEHTYDQKKLKIPSTTEGETVVFTEGEVEEVVSTTLTVDNIGKLEDVLPDSGFASMKKCRVGLSLITQQPTAPSKWSFTSPGDSIWVEGPDGYYKQGVDSHYTFPDGIVGAIRKISTVPFIAQSFEEPLLTAAEDTLNSREVMPIGFGFTIDGTERLIWLDTAVTIDMVSQTIVATLTGTKNTADDVIDVKITWAINGDSVYNLVLDKFNVNGIDRKAEITEETNVRVVAFATLDQVKTWG